MQNPQQISRAQIVAVLSSIVFVLSLGTVVFRQLEDWTWIESFYFTVVTTTTVGYGDLHPTTEASRLFATFFILFGVGVLVTAVGYTGSFFIRRSAMRIEKNHEKRDNKE